jgi:hypothetical protein
MVVKGVGTLCSVESGVQTPSRARSLSPCTNKVEIGNLEALEGPLIHFGGRGGYGTKAKAFQRPPLATTWPLYGLYMVLHVHNTAAIGKTANWRFGFFGLNFLPKLQKKLSLMFRHSYLACLLSWRTPLPFRLGWL